MSSAQWSRSRNRDGLTGIGGSGSFLEGGEEGFDGLGGQVFVVVIIDLDHGGIDAGTQTFDFDEGEEVVLGRVAGGDTQVFCDGLDDLVATAATELAGGLRTVSICVLRRTFHSRIRKLGLRIHTVVQT